VHVFDLDGTLIDTRDAVVEAYRRAGALMPRDAWGKPWWEWTDARTHDIKNLHYAYIYEVWVKPLPLLKTALRLNAPVITGASVAAVELAKKRFGPLNVQLTAADVSQKILFLNELNREEDGSRKGVYVDDDPRTREAVREETTWTSISPEVCLRSS
jgi:hypothetical protein